MLRAATRGVIDFSQMEFFSPRWKTRVRFLLQGLSAEYNRDLLLVLHRHTIAKFGLNKLTPESWDEIQEDGSESLNDVLAAYRPWEFGKKAKGEREKEEFTGLRNAWQQQYGSLDDPETEKRLVELREALLHRAGDQAPPSPMADAGVFNKDTANYLGNVRDLKSARE